MENLLEYRVNMLHEHIEEVLSNIKDLQKMQEDHKTEIDKLKAHVEELEHKIDSLTEAVLY